MVRVLRVFLGLAALLALFAARAGANHSPATFYTGTHSNGGEVVLRTSSDSARVESFRALDLKLNRGGCPDGVGVFPENVAIVDHRFQSPFLAISGTSTSISFDGSFSAPGRVAGILAISCGSAITLLSWSATSQTPTPPPPTPPPPPPPPSTPFFLGGHDRVAIVRGKAGVYDERIRAKFRECGGSPPFRLVVTQRRRVGATVVAQGNFNRRLTGAKAAPPTASGITCRNYVALWPLARKLYGSGWLTITLRIVDSRGGDSGAPNFALRAPKP